MRYGLTLALVGISLLAKPAPAQELPDWMTRSGWVPIYDVCVLQNLDKGLNRDCSSTRFSVQNTGFLQYWAGDVGEMYYELGQTAFTKMRVKVTHVTDNTSYRCGQIIEIYPEDVRDLEALSMALRKCR